MYDKTRDDKKSQTPTDKPGNGLIHQKIGRDDLSAREGKLATLSQKLPQLYRSSTIPIA